MRLDISWEGQSGAGSHKGEKAVVCYTAGEGKVFLSAARGFAARHQALQRGAGLFWGGARALLHLPCAAA